MTLSGPKLCLGSTKDARILPAFLHSSAKSSTAAEAKLEGYSLLIDAGSGLLIPKGISTNHRSSATRPALLGKVVIVVARKLVVKYGEELTRRRCETTILRSASVPRLLPAEEAAGDTVWFRVV